MGNFNPKNPTKFRGTDKYIAFFISRNRQPTLADYRQPETGNLYSIGTIWQVGKNPISGNEGDIYILSKIVANQAYWVLISSGQGNIDSIQVDASTPPGTNPVVATDGGLITITGGQIANAGLANVIRTNSLAANTFTIQVQQSGGDTVSNTTKNGVSHYNTTHFVIDTGAFISSQIATTSQIGIVTLASQVQSEYNTYGTTQVLQSQNIPFMFAKPAPIGSTTPNTGAFTNLTAAVSNGVPAVFTNTTAATNAINSSSRHRHGTSGTPAAGFGSAIELTCHNSVNSFETAMRVAGVWEDATDTSEDSFGQFDLQETGVMVQAAYLYPTRLELRNGSRYRLGSGGVDILSGAGDPNGAVTAAQGSLYLRTDGSSSSTRAYINTDGATAWTSVTTAT